MAATIKLYEDFGPVDFGRGTGTKLVYEATLTNEVATSASIDYTAAHNRVARPVAPGNFNYSYNRYFYVEVTGNFDKIYKLEWYIENPSSHVSDLFVTTTNTYAASVNTNFGGTLVSAPVVIQANGDVNGPNTATTFAGFENGTAFFSDYLVLQQRVGYMDAVSEQFTDPVVINCIAWEVEEL